MSDLEYFLSAMDGEWRVDHYELLDNGRLRVHYRSLVHPWLTWAHCPFNDFGEIPKVGTIGRIGFAAIKEPVHGQD